MGFFECMYRKHEYIFISFSSLPPVRKCNMTLKQIPPVVTGSAESPAVGNIWKQEHSGISHELPLHRKGGGESVHLTWREQVRAKSCCKERSQICSTSRHCLWLMWQGLLLQDCGWIQFFSCGPALPPHLIYAGCKSTLLPSAVPWLMHTWSD